MEPAATATRDDERRLVELMISWQAADLAAFEELYARLEWLAQRKELLAAVAKELEDSAIGAMLRMAPDDPDTLLDEIAGQLRAQVAEREAELAGLTSEA